MNSPRPLRFAVLHHTGVEPPHFDLLFETSPGSDLACFRLEAWPPADGAPAQRLRNHRRIYLTFEGDISGGRGSVIRVADGTADWDAGTATLQPVGHAAIRLLKETDDQYRVALGA